MKNRRLNRRGFLKSATAAATAAGTSPWWFSTEPAQAFDFKSANERPVLGSIGTGRRWGQIVGRAMQHGDVAAVCDVDSNRAEAAGKRCRDEQSKKGASREVDVYGDYRRILDRKDVDVVTIVTPDHWHSKIAVEAMQAGKDIYCEKPLTLTIEEGKQIVKVLKETKRVFQVGTQQRSEYYDKDVKILRFLGAVALVQSGRLGKIKRVQCAIGGAPTSGPIPVADVPAGLDWDMWQGPASSQVYRFKENDREGISRCHYEFRWWYEYSGGKLTDWGAHHVDIAQWAIEQNGEGQGPMTIEGTATHPVPFKNGHPTLDDRFNTATEFSIKAMFPNGVEMVIRHDTKNGITFEGEKGSFFVGRDEITGEPIDDLKQNPLPEDVFTKLSKGKKPGNHMRNFFLCVKSRDLPVSDVFSHHRALTTCHLANLAIRLGRKLTWDPQTEQIVGDSEANAWQAREPRKGFEIKV